MDWKFTLTTILGHVARVGVPVLVYFLTKAGMEGAEADQVATDAVTATTTAISAIVSIVWSLKGRKKLLAAKPPAK